MNARRVFGDAGCGRKLSGRGASDGAADGGPLLCIESAMRIVGADMSPGGGMLMTGNGAALSMRIGALSLVGGATLMGRGTRLLPAGIGMSRRYSPLVPGGFFFFPSIN